MKTNPVYKRECMVSARSFKLALVLLVLLPVLLTMALRRRRQMSAASQAAKVKTGTINAAIESGLSGVRTLSLIHI